MDDWAPCQAGLAARAAEGTADAVGGAELDRAVRHGDLHRKAWATSQSEVRSADEKHKRGEFFVEQIPRAVRWVEADDEHHVEEDENQVDFWAACGNDCLASQRFRLSRRFPSTRRCSWDD